MSAGSTNGKIDHLGIAVKSIAEARKFYEALGLSVEATETVEAERVRAAMVPLGDSRIELLEATDEASVIAKFISKRGEGLHHVAIAVPDIEAAGHLYVFVHPSSAGGVLVELVQSA
jgi:methylmalonyl-CoA epimerase